MGDRKQYSTKQKNAVMNFMIQHKNKCFSAKDFIENNDFNIGEATVYRLLSKLADEGRLKRFVADKGGATYQYNDSGQYDNHFHLKCTKCGETVCMNCSFMNEMGSHVENEHDFFVDSTKTVIFGICKECRHYAKGGL